MRKKLLLGVVAALGCLVAVIATRPATYTVQRSISVAAPPAAAFVLVNDFHQWPRWSPWEGLDPNMRRTHSGAESGTGAVYAWEGNSEVGKGQMTIQASTPAAAVDIDLQFIEPFASSSTTEFRFTEQGGATAVTWTMHGNNDFVGKAFSLFMDMDAMIGADFEKGLAKLKATAEAVPAGS